MATTLSVSHKTDKLGLLYARLGSSATALAHDRTGSAESDYPKRMPAFASALSVSSATVSDTACAAGPRPAKSARQWSSRSGPAGAGGGCPNRKALWRTLLTVLTVLSSLARMLIILLPARPSRLNVMSMPKALRNVCARRSRPASARGLLGQPVRLSERPSQLRPAPSRSRSTAVPVHELRSAMISRTQEATGSASIIPSIADLRLAS